MGYAKVVQMLNDLFHRHATRLDPFQRTLLRQYLEVLRRHVVKDVDLVREAQELYAKHQRAFDFVFENRPSYRTSLHDHLKKFISRRKEVRLDSEDPSYFRFVPVAWDKIRMLRTKVGWEGGSLVSCELNTPDSEQRRLDLHVVLHLHGSKSDLKLGRLIYRSVEHKPAPHREFLWVCSRRIPVPGEFSEEINEDVAGEVNSYLRDELLRVTAAIKRVVATRS
jgi:hypothetical protein